MRFASHRDIARAVERGIRRAGLPVAHSAGFSPHPKISYAGGAPTGAASEAEYLEISLTASIEPDVLRDRLDAALPDGIDVIEVADLAVAAAPRLEASDWQVELPGVAADQAASAVHAFLASTQVEVERLTSSGVRRLDARAGVVSLEVDRRAQAAGQPGYAILRMVVRHLTPAVRPDDILVGLRHVSGLELPLPARVTRLAQGPLEGVSARDPMGADAAAAEASAPGPGIKAAVAGLSGPPVPVGPTTADGAAEAAGRGWRDTTQGQMKTTRPDAAGASTAHPAPVSAYEQLPRGAERPEQAACAREPDQKDRPDARNRAREQRVP
jgi:radical SAM-linked protein